MAKKGWKPQNNICWDCKKACGKCSWTAVNPLTGELLWQPVPGWTAEKIERVVHPDVVVETYHITACPLFEPDDKRKGTQADLTADEEKAWLEAIRREYGVWADG